MEKIDCFRTTSHINREIYVANYYLYLYPEKYPSAKVRAEDFFACAEIGEWWSKAEELVSKKREWSFLDICPAQNWDEDAIQKQQAVADAGKDYVEHQIGLFERQILEASSMRFTLHELGCAQDSIINGCDSEDLVVKMQRVLKLLQGTTAQSWVLLKEAAIKVATEYCDSIASGELVTLKMPLKGMQEALKGWPLKKLIMILGITSGHKTTLCRMSVEHYARNGGISAYITMEDTPEHIAARSMSAESHGAFTVGDLLSGNTTEAVTSGIISAAGKIEQENPKMWICHGSFTLSKLKAKIREAAAKGAKMIGIDFVQLTRPNSGESRGSDFMFDVCNDLQVQALETGTCIVACVQPTKEGRQNALLGKTMTGADIRGGSSIEQAAFGILVLGFDYMEDQKRKPGIINMTIDKWKTSEGAGYNIVFGLDPAHDRIFDRDEEAAEESFYGNTS